MLLPALCFVFTQYWSMTDHSTTFLLRYPDLTYMSWHSTPVSISVCAVHTWSYSNNLTKYWDIFWTKPSCYWNNIEYNALMISLCVTLGWLLRPTVGRFLLTTVSRDLSSQPVKLQTDGNLELTACPVQLPVTVDLSTSSLVTTYYYTTHQRHAWVVLM